MDDFLQSWFRDKRLSCHNVTEKKTALEAFVGMHEGLRTYLYDGTFTHMHTFFFCFLSERHVTSGWGGGGGAGGWAWIIRCHQTHLAYPDS